jgi:hypothetical protein
MGCRLAANFRKPVPFKVGLEGESARNNAPRAILVLPLWKAAGGPGEVGAVAEALGVQVNPPSALRRTRECESGRTDGRSNPVST